MWSNARQSLGPILFIIHINDLVNCVPNAVCDIDADDAVLLSTGEKKKEAVRNNNANLLSIRV